MLSTEALKALHPHVHLQLYHQKEIIFQEGDTLPAELHILLSGTLQIKKSTATGKETVLRLLRMGDFFALPALFDESFCTVIVLATEDSQVLTVSKTTLLNAIQHTPELAMQFLVMLNQRLQQQHNTVHGLVSERAVVRLARLIHYSALHQGTELTVKGEQLQIQLPYNQIARSIGATYEECTRLMKKLTDTVKYNRGGKITIFDWEALAAIASGDTDLV